MSTVYITKASSNLIIRGFLRLDIEQKGGVDRYLNLRELRAHYKMKMIFQDLPELIESMGFN